MTPTTTDDLRRALQAAADTADVPTTAGQRLVGVRQRVVRDRRRRTVGAVAAASVVGLGAVALATSTTTGGQHHGAAPTARRPAPSVTTRATDPALSALSLPDAVHGRHWWQGPIGGGPAGSPADDTGETDGASLDLTQLPRYVAVRCAGDAELRFTVVRSSRTGSTDLEDVGTRTATTARCGGLDRVVVVPVVPGTLRGLHVGDHVNAYWEVPAAAELHPWLAAAY